MNIVSPPLVGQIDHVEDRRHRRVLAPGDVGVPHVGTSAAIAVEHDDLRVLVVELRDERVDLDLAEAACEGDVAVGRQRLVGQEDDVVLDERGVQRVELTSR